MNDHEGSRFVLNSDSLTGYRVQNLLLSIRMRYLAHIVPELEGSSGSNIALLTRLGGFIG